MRRTRSILGRPVTRVAWADASAELGRQGGVYLLWPTDQGGPAGLWMIRGER